MNWGPGDFIAAAGLLISAFIAWKFVLNRVSSATHRVLIGIAILAVLVLLWVELAVGLFDSPIAGD